MSDTALALVLTVAVLAVLVLWVPLLDRVCPPCGRMLRRVRQLRPAYTFAAQRQADHARRTV